MYLLDTDTTSNYLDKRRVNPVLRARIDNEPPENIFISIITVEEILKGALSLINKARKHPRNPDKLIDYLAVFHRLAHDLMGFAILPYDIAAEAKYNEIPNSVRQKHSQDCHIAAVAASLDYTVITRNLQDFRKMNIVKCADWTSSER